MTLRFCLVPLALVACSSTHFTVSDATITDVGDGAVDFDAPALDGEIASDSPIVDSSDGGVLFGPAIWVDSASTCSSSCDGSKAKPYPTFTAALATISSATDSEPSRILACAGTYDEQVTVTASNIDIYGSVDCANGGTTFASAAYSVIKPDSCSGPIFVISGAADVHLWYLRITAPDQSKVTASQSSGAASSIALFIANSTGVAIHGSYIEAGPGGTGFTGDVGDTGGAGADGSPAEYSYTSVSDAGTSFNQTAITSDTGLGGGSGSSMGGNGGGVVTGGIGSIACQTYATATAGLNGAGFTGSASTAGGCGLGVPAAGAPGLTSIGCTGAVPNPVVNTAPVIGSLMTTAPFGYSASNIGSNAGNSGSAGGGGGGGHSAGYSSGTNYSCASGDGGGAGGGGGGGGKPGGGGGASVAIVVFDSTFAPAGIDSTSIATRVGGQGGAGGAGGQGGAGGAPGDIGTTGVNLTNINPISLEGAAGGIGGSGGGGAGGGGGPSVGILYNGTSAPPTTNITWTVGVWGANGALGGTVPWTGTANQNTNTYQITAD